MSDMNFKTVIYLIVLIITKTTESGQVELADIMSARLLVDNEKLAQAVHEVPERLKVYAEA